MKSDSFASTSSHPITQNPTDQISTVAAAMWLTVVGTLGILFLPLMVGGIIAELGFSELQAGYVAAAEMAGVAIASGLGVFWVRRVDWVKIGTLSTIVLIAANWVSMGIDGYWAMIVARFCVGLASGALLAIGMACQSDSKNADRIFGYWVACQMTVSSVGYLILPSVRANWGIDGFLLALIAVGATAFISIAFLPKRGLDRIASSGKQRTTILTNTTALFGALLFFMAQGGLWAFLERLGLSSSLTTTEIGFALAISSYCGIAGGLAKNWLVDAAGTLSPFILVIVGELFMLVLFAVEPGNVLFAVAVCLLQFFWAMGMASFLSAFNLVDQSGALVLLLMSVAKVGYSLGPAMMGWLIVDDNYSNVLLASGVLVVIGLLTTTILIKIKLKSIDGHTT
jgi:predicted MFS family arabinose efflux permease